MGKAQDPGDCLISIVIPVYNKASCIRRAVVSCLAQSYRAIEVVCVDDGSTDESPAVLRSCAEEDSRLRLVEFGANRGAHCARAAGVEAASGDFITFLDGDDELSRGACALIASEMRRQPCDILHLGSKVIGEGGTSSAQIRAMTDWLDPKEPLLKGFDISYDTYVRHRCSYNVWGKAFRASLAKRAFRALGERLVELGEDGYEYFALAFFADEYRGVANSSAYIYHYGSGVTGKSGQSSHDFSRALRVREAVEGVRDFLLEQDASEDYDEVVRSFERKQLSYLVYQWFENVREADKEECMRAILAQWERGEVVDAAVDFGTPAMRFVRLCLAEPFPCSAEQAWRWGRVDGMAEAREEYVTSISFRIGRMLTWVPRKVMGRGGS